MVHEIVNNPSVASEAAPAHLCRWDASLVVKDWQGRSLTKQLRLFEVFIISQCLQQIGQHEFRILPRIDCEITEAFVHR